MPIVIDWVQTSETIYQTAISKLIAINVYKFEDSWQADLYFNNTGKPEFYRGYNTSEEAKEASLNRALEIIRGAEKQALAMLGREV